MNLTEGIIPPMVTPLTEEDLLDRGGVKKLIEHLIGGGVHGLFILGTTGEGPSLSYSVRIELIKTVCKQTNGRVSVLGGGYGFLLQRNDQHSRKSQGIRSASCSFSSPF